MCLVHGGHPWGIEKVRKGLGKFVDSSLSLPSRACYYFCGLWTRSLTHPQPKEWKENVDEVEECEEVKQKVDIDIDCCCG